MNIRKGLFITFWTGYARTLIQFIASLFIARLLTPAEFGVFSVAMILVLVADTLRNFGMASYIVQERDLTPARLSSASGLNYLTSWSIGGLVYLLADPAARFYGAEGVGEVMRLLVASFLILPVGAATMSFMEREMMFDRLAAIQLTKVLVATISSVLLAFNGFSYMSLAWGYLLSNIAGVLLIWGCKPAGLRIRPGLRELRPVLRFGALATVNSLAKEGGNRLPDLILGRLISIEAVAFFARADGLIEVFRRLVVSSISYVAMPHFAAEVRNRQDPVPKYLLATTHLCLIGWPFFGVAAITAPQLIPFLFGDQWDASIPLARFLCVGEMFLLPFCLQDQVLVAKGRMGLVTGLSLLSTGFRLFAIVALAAHGLTPAIAGYAATSLIAALALYRVALRVVGVPAVDFWSSLGPSLRVTAVTLLAAGAAAAGAEAAGLSDLVRLWSILAVAAIGWFIGLQLSAHPLRHELARFTLQVRRRLRRGD